MAKAPKKKFTQFEIPQLNNASKTLLANIRFASLDDKIKTIVVTSSVADEGKTTVATNLAAAIASSDKKVLIVDADMRQRSIGSLLGIRPVHGMYAALSEKVSLNEAIVATAIPNLYFMDTESNVLSPPDILSTKRFAALVNQLHDMFDYVIFDAPPVGLFIDAAIISNLVDGTLFAIRQRKTKHIDVLRNINQLRSADGHILGVVMTFSDNKENDYSYAYYNQEKKRVSKDNTANSDMRPNTATKETSWLVNDTTGDNVREETNTSSNTRTGQGPYTSGAFKPISRANVRMKGRHGKQ